MSSQRFLDLSLSSPQHALAASMATNDLAEFKRALRNGASVNVRDQDAEYSIFEIACSTPGKKDFIAACLKQSALVAEINPKTSEYPIHLAALSEDCENLSVLLESPRIVIDQKFEDRTALFLLFENLSGDNYEKIDFSNFVPPAHKAHHSDSSRTPVGLLYDDEMLPILRMAQYSDMKHLLRHPVISSILLLKWFKLSVFFYINLLICTVFFVSFIFYVVFCYGRDDAPFKLFFYSLSLIGLLYLILRELIQFLLNMRVYVRSPENYMEIALILAASSVLLYEFGDDARRVASALVILLTALEFTLLVGTLPLLSISTHMVMLKTVSKNFLKCLVLYSIILLAFAFSFYTLFRVNDSNASDKATTSEAPNGDDDQFNQFSDIPLSLMKTAVMLTGGHLIHYCEFEAANIKFQGVTYVVFALFLFFVSIVLFNLMNGLAVSDTTTIKAESELIGLIQKVFVIYKYENALKTSKPIRCITDNMSWLYPANSLQLFPNTVPLRHITIKPNRSNTIMIPSLVERGTLDPEKGTLEMKRSAESDRMLPQTDTFSTNCCVFRFNRGMDGKIVKYALEILHSRQESVGSIEYRISRIEQSLESIKAMILALSSK
uniref:Ion transport domain-containing protein n=1 Tax=Anopheles albimanus TaxID=7167 RepID=A0A8W7JW41_ANOAL